MRSVFERIRGLLRVSAYGAFVFGSLAAVAMRSAWGDVGESSMIVGRELLSVKDLVARSHAVRINGEEVFVASATVPGKHKDVLDQIERLCREGSKELDEIIKDPESKLTPEGRTALSALGLSGLGIMRREGPTEGMVGCLARTGNGGLVGLSERLGAFAQTLDLGEIGKLRYVYTQQEGDTTHVVTVWTDGSLKVNQMFPQTGEPAGSDPPGMPRITGSQRLLSAEVDGAPYGVRIYDVPGTAGEALAFYDKQMSEQGWESTSQVVQVEPNARHFAKEGIELLMSFQEAHGRTAISVVAMQAQAELVRATNRSGDWGSGNTRAEVERSTQHESPRTARSRRLGVNGRQFALFLPATLRTGGFRR